MTILILYAVLYIAKCSLCEFKRRNWSLRGRKKTNEQDVSDNVHGSGQCRPLPEIRNILRFSRMDRDKQFYYVNIFGNLFFFFKSNSTSTHYWFATDATASQTLYSFRYYKKDTYQFTSPQQLSLVAHASPQPFLYIDLKDRAKG